MRPGQNQRDNEKDCANISTETDEVRMEKSACVRAAQTYFCQLRSGVERLQMETERQRFNRLHRSQCVIKNLGFVDNTAAFVFLVLLFVFL